MTGGNLRLLTRLLTEVERVLGVNDPGYLGRNRRGSWRQPCHRRRLRLGALRQIIPHPTLPSAPRKSCAFLLTRTYMDARNTPRTQKSDKVLCPHCSVSELAILHHSRSRLSSQGAFPEHFAPEYGNQIDGEGNGQDPESRPRCSDSSESTQEQLCYPKTGIPSDETASTLIRPLSQRRVSSDCDSDQAKCNTCS